MTTPRDIEAPPPVEIQDSSAEPSADGHYHLTLYVTGATPRSTRAIERVRAVCEEELSGRYTLVIVDVYQQPEALSKDQIVAAPTLVKWLPGPRKRLIGDMSDRDRVLAGLGLQRRA